MGGSVGLSAFQRSLARPSTCRQQPCPHLLGSCQSLEAANIQGPMHKYAWQCSSSPHQHLVAKELFIAFPSTTPIWTLARTCTAEACAYWLVYNQQTCLSIPGPGVVL